jgi:hypothetical protein
VWPAANTQIKSATIQKALSLLNTQTAIYVNVRQIPECDVETRPCSDRYFAVKSNRQELSAGSDAKFDQKQRCATD